MDFLVATMLENQTKIDEFILLGFHEFYEFQTLFFLSFLVIYIVTMIGNVLIVMLVIFDEHLKVPMYFFLGNLSFLEICYSSNIFPRMLSALLTGNGIISFSNCFMQWYLCSSLVATECCLLCVMSYDRYLAICKPLHYLTTMNSQTCIYLAASSWINGFAVFSILLILILQQLKFCRSNEINHYFCDYFALLSISCSPTWLLEIMSYIVATVFTLPPFLLTLLSYVYIIGAVLKIPSVTGRQKAFSTCSSHLVVVSIFYGSLMIAYMLPRIEKADVPKFSSLLYIALPPLANPFIYSLRNKEVKEALRKKIGRLILYKPTCI
ncbi:olfactory receptor 2AP1-like [Thamnophis elegans]|uniref:olfactory receptor 2AP1-like n=1 Tax=Thamnophis elegans TaxID=35005 RepID=UPI001376D471|nr:olfactory receptor 2AP1-like [Thamnophis elegans]